MHSIFYFVKESVRGFYQAKLMTFVSIMTIAAALLFMSIICIGFLNIETLMNKTGDQPDLALYLKESVTNEEQVRDTLAEKIKLMPMIERFVFVSKDSAWERFAGIYGQEMLESVNENPLPSSFELFIKDGMKSGKIAQQIKKELSTWNEVESVRYSREWMSLIEKFRLYFLIISIALALIMIPALHFMISNTIKLTIYARKELVRNMHMVGATETFVNMPFILEGMLQGFIGGGFCVVILTILKVLFSHISIVWGPGYLPLLILSLGVLFGWIGSISAVRKFLA